MGYIEIKIDKTTQKLSPLALSIASVMIIIFSLNLTEILGPAMQTHRAEDRTQRVNVRDNLEWTAGKLVVCSIKLFLLLENSLNCPQTLYRFIACKFKQFCYYFVTNENRESGSTSGKIAQPQKMLSLLRKISEISVGSVAKHILLATPKIWTIILSTHN
jgi:hypothetical protein